MRSVGYGEKAKLTAGSPVEDRGGCELNSCNTRPESTARSFSRSMWGDTTGPEESRSKKTTISDVRGKSWVG
jgi:hypothetical protein